MLQKAYKKDRGKKLPRPSRMSKSVIRQGRKHFACGEPYGAQRA